MGHRPACDVVVDALRRMEYRGYDSAGLAILDGDGGLTVRRRAGRLANLEAALAETDADSLRGTAGIGHTRWATHGRPTDRNAHPHRDAAGKFAVVHNGIIENYAPLRAELEEHGVEFASDTDTEVAVHLVARAYQHGETAGDFVDGRIVLDEQRLSDQELREVDKVFIVACGTAFHSGLLAKYAIEHWTRLPVEVELASEFRYRDPVLDRGTLVIAISQSGETADTLEAVRHAKAQKAKVLAICNTNGSQIPREADAVLYTRAGPEIGVAATKTFLAQLTANYLVGLALAQARGTKYPDEVEREYRELEAMPALVEQVLGHLDSVTELGRRFAQSPTVLFLGRHVGYPVALEGALKLKELAYMHAEGFAAGELKHGPIALIEDGLPVIIVMPSPKNAAMLHGKLLSNIREIQARGAITIVIAEEGDETVRPYADHIIEIPSVSTLFQPLLSTIPLQVFAASVARARGYDVDKPRNLAKSVTVE